MKAVGEVTACVVDGGLFPEVAIALAKKYKRVLYQNTIDGPFPKIHEACIGDGIPDIQRIQDFWSIKKEIDLFVFPDCSHAPLQEELVRQGYPVWGGRGGIDLELKRVKFKELLADLGLSVGGYHVCYGLKALKEHLWDKKDKWIKISKFRGNRETWHWSDRDTSWDNLDQLAVELGPMQDFLPFVVEDCIETTIEWGYDGYFCAGSFPRLSAQGPETKDKALFSSITRWDQLPDQVKGVLEAMTVVLGERNYTNFISAEIRITEDNEAYFTDPTCRFPLPATGAQLVLYGNVPEIIWYGANGECIDPEPVNNFAVECMIDHTGDDQGWRILRVKDEFRDYVKLTNFTQFGHELYGFPPLPHSCDSVGSLVGDGKTIEEAIEAVKDRCDECFGDQPVNIQVEALASGLTQIQEAKGQGVLFTRQEIPDPAMVL